MKPINGHVQIEPEQHQDFIASMTPTYDEIGIVIAVADGIDGLYAGDKVYFDSWMASKFPAGEGKHNWLIPYENIKAIEPLSEKHLSGGIPPQVRHIGDTTSGVTGTM